jgi:hypothetical protein
MSGDSRGKRMTGYSRRVTNLKACAGGIMYTKTFWGWRDIQLPDGAGNRLGYCPNACKDAPQRADADPAPSVDQANWLAAALPGDKAHAPVVSLRWDR